MWPAYHASLTQRTWQWTMQQNLLATQAELFLTTKESVKETGLIQMSRKICSLL
jgi:hypothetical protein